MAKKRGWLLRLTLVLAIVIAGSAGLAAILWYTAPYDIEDSHFVEIRRGMSSRAIARELASEGVIRSQWAFLLVRALRYGKKLQAGEYEFSGSYTTWQVFDKISEGKVYFVELTVPEGSNMFDIAALLKDSEMVQSDDFLQAARDVTSIRDLDAQAPTLEGYLFPSTYRLTHTTTAKDLCRMMTAEFRKQWQAARHDAGSDIHRVVTLASLVEKETAIPQERPLVAAVFSNRLRLNMPLQCDPTTVYAALLENRFRGTIYKSDLTSVNPYNTYAHAGLPPGPIANPGLQALKAALAPAASNALYFVAKGDGSGAHHFSETLLEHRQAVASYRKLAH